MVTMSVQRYQALGVRNYMDLCVALQRCSEVANLLRLDLFILMSAITDDEFLLISTLKIMPYIT